MSILNEVKWAAMEAATNIEQATKDMDAGKAMFGIAAGTLMLAATTTTAEAKDWNPSVIEKFTKQFQNVSVVGGFLYNDNQPIVLHMTCGTSLVKPQTGVDPKTGEIYGRVINTGIPYALEDAVRTSGQQFTPVHLDTQADVEQVGGDYQYDTSNGTSIDTYIDSGIFRVGTEIAIGKFTNGNDCARSSGGSNQNTQGGGTAPSSECIPSCPGGGGGPDVPGGGGGPDNPPGMGDNASISMELGFKVAALEMTVPHPEYLPSNRIAIAYPVLVPVAA